MEHIMYGGWVKIKKRTRIAQFCSYLLVQRDDSGRIKPVCVKKKKKQIIIIRSKIPSRNLGIVNDSLPGGGEMLMLVMRRLL